MRGKLKAQISIEFIALMALAALMMIIFGSIASTQIKDVTSEHEFQMIKDLSYSITNELDLSARVHTGYERTFAVPLDLDGIPFNMTIINNQLVISTQRHEYSTSIPPVQGSLKMGTNLIMREAAIVCLNEGCIFFDTAAPYVKSTKPADGATNVPVPAEIRAYFSENMNATSVESSFTVLGLSGAANYSDVYFDALFTPDSIDYNTTYTARVDNTSYDLAGNYLSSRYEWTFTTELDTYPPASVSNLHEANVTESSIMWVWANPADADFDFSEVLVNGTPYANTSDPYINVTGLAFETSYEILVRTWDIRDNTNNEWVNDSAATVAPSLLYADLWDMAADLPEPVDFTSGMNSSANTFGLGAGDDGWDTGYHTYDNGTVYFGGANIAELVRFNPNATESAGGVDRRLVNEGGTTTRIEIEVAGHEWLDPDTGADNDMISGAVGIQFEVTPAMWTILVLGGNATAGFDWWVLDPQGLEHPVEAVWVKARIHNASGAYYLGTNMDGDANATDDDYIDAVTDSTADVHYALAPNGASANGSAAFGITSTFNGPGIYYLDIGGKVSDYSVFNEYMVIAIDNVYVKFER